MTTIEKTAESQLPEFLTKNDAGVLITFNKPMNMMGAQVGYIQMREPTVADQLVATAIAGGEVKQEIGLFANLCDVSPEDITALTLHNYGRVQAGFKLFLL